MDIRKLAPTKSVHTIIYKAAFHIIGIIRTGTRDANAAVVAVTFGFSEANTAVETLQWSRCWVGVLGRATAVDGCGGKEGKGEDSEDCETHVGLKARDFSEVWFWSIEILGS